MSLALPLAAPLPPGFGRAFGRTTVFGYQRGVTVPLPGVLVAPFVPGTTTPWPDPLYLDESDAAPAVFPVATDATGAIALWGAEPGRLELECRAVGYGTQRVILDLEVPPPSDTDDPYPQYLTDSEADALFLTQSEGDLRYAPLGGSTFTNPYPDPMVFEAGVDGLVFTQNGKAVLDTDHEAAVDPHAQYATDTDLTDHAGAVDPHPGYATDADLGAHAAAVDPHPVYLTQAEADSRYALASSLTALTARVATLEGQVATLQSQMTTHLHANGTVGQIAGAPTFP
jgi:hypothetical protein